MVGSGGALAAAGFLTLVTGVGVASQSFAWPMLITARDRIQTLIKGLLVGGAAVSEWARSWLQRGLP